MVLVVAFVASLTLAGCATTQAPPARYAQAAEMAGNLVCLVLRVTRDDDETIDEICEHAREILRALREYAKGRTKESTGKTP